MRIVALITALIGLVLTIVPSVFVFLGNLSWGDHSQLMFIGMLLWFIFAPIGMKRRKLDMENKEE
jgi:uncharacterized protein YqgC (DUF456 family)